MAKDKYMGKCPELKFDPCKRTNVRGRCETSTKPVLSKECGKTHVSDKVLFVKFDGVLYAVYEQSEAYARWKFANLQADAYFKRMEESDVLKEHHALALQLLEKMPKEQADMFRNISDNKAYGTIKYEDFYKQE